MYNFAWLFYLTELGGRQKLQSNTEHPNIIWKKKKL